jgi:aminoglycoside phosphotransferase
MPGLRVAGNLALDGRATLSFAQMHLAPDYVSRIRQTTVREGDPLEPSTQDALADLGASLVSSSGSDAMSSATIYTVPTDPVAYLATFQRELVLSTCPRGSAITGVRFAPQWMVKGPALVTVTRPDGSEQKVVVKMSDCLNGVLTEAELLPVLTRLGLPVPAVLAPPAFDPQNPHTGPALVLSYLPGSDLQRLSEASPRGLETAGRLVMDGIARLHALTGAIRRQEVGHHLPQITLLTELRMVVERGGPWLQVPLFREAVQQLVPILAQIRTPLEFSNGDYQPANFLTDGESVTGFVDFVVACFEDPHYGVAKYRVYDMAPLNGAGFVEQYLEAHHLSEAEFAPRLAVRCLWTLQKEISIAELDAGDGYSRRVIQLLSEALRLLG